MSPLCAVPFGNYRDNEKEKESDRPVCRGYVGRLKLVASLRVGRVALRAPVVKVVHHPWVLEREGAVSEVLSMHWSYFE